MRRRLAVCFWLVSACSSQPHQAREMDASSSLSVDGNHTTDASGSETGNAQSGTDAGLYLCQQNCGLPKDPDEPFDSRCPKSYPLLTADASQLECSIEDIHCYYCRGGVVTKSVQCAKATGQWVSQLVCAVP